MGKTKTNSLKIEADTPEQATSMTIDGCTEMSNKLEIEGKHIKKLMLSVRFHKGSAYVTEQGNVYKELICIVEQIFGVGATEIRFTLSANWGKSTYTMDILLALQ